LEENAAAWTCWKEEVSMGERRLAAVTGEEEVGMGERSPAAVTGEAAVAGSACPVCPI
jgi:hypothetical protein